MIVNSDMQVVGSTHLKNIKESINIMRKNKSMLAKTMFCCLGVGLTMSSLIVPLGVSLFSSNSQPNGLTT